MLSKLTVVPDMHAPIRSRLLVLYDWKIRSLSWFHSPRNGPASSRQFHALKVIHHTHVCMPCAIEVRTAIGMSADNNSWALRPVLSRIFAVGLENGIQHISPTVSSR